jgi:hypothetical protein
MHSYNFVSEFELCCANFSAMCNNKNMIGDLQQTMDVLGYRPRDGLRRGGRLLSLLQGFFTLGRSHSPGNYD